MYELKITSNRLDAMVNIQEYNVSFKIRIQRKSAYQHMSSSVWFGSI